MLQGHEEFCRQLVDLGFAPTKHGERSLWIEYEVRYGPLEGTTIRLGFEVPPEFPRTPPSGPHVSPAGVFTSRPRPMQGLHASGPFGQDWVYLSRPFHRHGPGRNSVTAYLAFVDAVLADL